MKKALINGLDEVGVNILLTFMESKLNDSEYKNSIEYGGNSCDMDWIENDMDISGEDMVHELFEMYGDEDNEGYYKLIINDSTFYSSKKDENWSDYYEYFNKK